MADYIPPNNKDRQNPAKIATLEDKFLKGKNAERFQKLRESLPSNEPHRTNKATKK